MAKKKVRIDEWEANRLNDLLKDKTIVTKKGHEGRVTRITRGGIQVHLPNSKTIRPYPIYDPFISGDLRFKEKVCQNEMLKLLQTLALIANMLPTDNHNRRCRQCEGCVGIPAARAPRAA